MHAAITHLLHSSKSRPFTFPRLRINIYTSTHSKTAKICEICLAEAAGDVISGEHVDTIGGARKSLKSYFVTPAAEADENDDSIKDKYLAFRLMTAESLLRVERL